ncbi:MAG: PqiC family protein [Rhodospirillales bacterium]
MFVRVGSVIAVAAVSFVAGCASTPPTNFYTLSSVVPATQGGSAQAPAAVVAIGPVSLPDYIDRPQIVTRESAYAVKVASYDQWAGPLTDMVPRVLIDNVAAGLPQDRVVGFPRVSGTSFDYRIAVDITRFDADPSGTATLVAHWQIYDRVARRALLVTDDTFVRQAANTSYEAIVAAMSGTLADLSDRLADDVAATTAAAGQTRSSVPPSH